MAGRRVRPLHYATGPTSAFARPTSPAQAAALKAPGGCAPPRHYEVLQGRLCDFQA